jgi:AraC-like DNA-binding protein
LRHVAFADPDALSVMVRPWADVVLLGRADGPARCSWAALGDIQFRSVSGAGRFHIGGTVPAGSVMMQLDLRSEGLRRLGGRSVGRDDIIVGLGGAPVDFTSAPYNDGMNLTLPESLVATAIEARRHTDRRRRPASQFIMSNCGPATAQIRWLAGVAFDPGAVNAPAHAFGDVVDVLVRTLMVPWSSHEETVFRSAPYQRRPIVQRVESFMRANLGAPLMLHDLCAAGKASERAVEYAFRDTYGVGAKKYLKLLRLNRLRRELRSQPPGAANISGIARACGFWHMGHFSESYRRLFGESPRQTCARREPASPWEPELRLRPAG